MLQIRLTGAFRAAANNADTIDIQAQTIRELMFKLVEQYPLMKRHVDEGIAVSINGNIYRDDWGANIPADSEVFLIPRIQGG